MLEGLFGKTVQLAERRDGRSSTRPTSASRSCNPAAKIAAGFQPIMPTFQGLVSEEQLLQLIAYVKSLQAARPARRSAGSEERRS